MVVQYKDIRVSTETVNHRSQAVNYGKPILLEYYVVWCLNCKHEPECVTANVIDGEEVHGTIVEPVISLRSAFCKKCNREWYF